MFFMKDGVFDSWEKVTMYIYVLGILYLPAYIQKQQVYLHYAVE